MTSRQKFEQFVLEYTGRDIDYHNKSGTVGLDFAWECWKKASTLKQNGGLIVQEDIVATVLSEGVSYVNK